MPVVAEDISEYKRRWATWQRFFRCRERRGYSLSRVLPRSLLHSPHLLAIDWGAQSLAPSLQPARGCSVHSQFWCGSGGRAQGRTKRLRSGPFVSPRRPIGTPPVPLGWGSGRGQNETLAISKSNRSVGSTTRGHRDDDRRGDKARNRQAASDPQWKNGVAISENCEHTTSKSFLRVQRACSRTRSSWRH
jgi:hypothetical protein